ncbi:Sec-independent protein translocase subunit TatA [Streptomyces sp. A1136]|uniref:Sec-independent protein translocase subunit TatA n=1 Tax=Streptomyces sp. A1136 TaxID=2563102 RepID=UPI00109E7265|nr:Sec-independent protein translocase subunit TatA [Streptomyces sp. A1136]THA44562.1 Sec-independent protein translocase subunit TatA [Streptomyces sp. A1136]
MLRNGLEPWHLLIVAIVLIVLFGSQKLPDTARSLGKSLRTLKSETRAIKEDAMPPSADAAPTGETLSQAIHVTPGDVVSAAPAPESGTRTS